MLRHQSRPVRYAVAALAVTLIVGTRSLLTPYLGDRAAFLLFPLAVMAAARLGGPGPGHFATSLSALLGTVLFLPTTAGVILSNAARYTTPGGNIWLRAERDGDEVVDSVRDTGIGIREEMLPLIFDMFTQDRDSGSGLGVGLALVRRIVQLHGGTVEASSDGEGRGSEFVVRLPAQGVPVDARSGGREWER